MNPHLILPISTQVVSRVERASSDGRIICPKGAVERIIHAPTDNSHTDQRVLKSHPSFSHLSSVDDCAAS